jgi:integrase
VVFSHRHKHRSALPPEPFTSSYPRRSARFVPAIARKSDAARTFGFHTFRRTLASVLVKMKVDVKTVQEILRHQNLKTTLEIYARSMSEDRLLAQGMFLELLFSHKRPEPLDGVAVEQ